VPVSSWPVLHSLGAAGWGTVLEFRDFRGGRERGAAGQDGRAPGGREGLLLSRTGKGTCMKGEPEENECTQSSHTAVPEKVLWMERKENWSSLLCCYGNDPELQWFSADRLWLAVCSAAWKGDDKRRGFTLRIGTLSRT
jgi:hypothetical protein